MGTASKMIYGNDTMATKNKHSHGGNLGGTDIEALAWNGADKAANK